MTSGSSALRLPCPACASSVEPGADLCGGCGSPLGVAQRRIVTVAFADLVGYTALASRLDHEEVHLLVRPLMNGLRRICEDLGGQVPAIEGDGFMAVFGALRSDPEDPHRASVAAARMQRLVKERQQATAAALSGLRVGLHVGEVLVAPSWERHGFSVSGDVVNVASRLCSEAGPAEVLATAELLALLPEATASAPRSILLRNRAEEISVVSLAWADTEVPEKPLVRPSLGGLVGRSEELRRLTSGERDACVLVVGDSGSGKTRLVREWVFAEGGLVLESRCSAFEVSGERAVLRDLLLGVAGGPEPLRALVAAAHEVEQHEQDGSATLGDLVEAVADVVLEAAAATPTTVVLDDVQWATATVQELVRRLAGSRVRPRLVLVSRSAPAWLQPDRTLELSPLDEPATRALVQSLLPGCDEELQQLLVDRSGGLPLFVEQCVDLLLEEGTVQYLDGSCTLVDPAGLSRIPTGMRLFVSARLDLLPERERRVLLTAAVLGDRVDRRLLAALHPDADPAVEALLERGLIRREPVEGLAFAHALVRDVAYAGQLRRARRDIHCAAADWYGILPAREMLEARAKHLRAAVDLTTSPDCQLALDAVLAMSAWVASIVAERPAEAVAVVEDVLHLDAQLPQCRLPLLEARLAAAVGYELVGNEDEAARQARLAAPLAAERGDAAAHAEAALLEGRSLVLSQPAEAEAKLAEAVAAFREAGDRAGAARAEVERAIMLEPSEGLMPVLRAHESSYRVGIQTGDKRLVAHAAQQLALFWATRSRQDSASWVDRASAASRSDDATGAATVLLADAVSCQLTMQLRRGAHLARRAISEAQACGADFVLRNAVMIALECHLQLGELDAAEELRLLLAEMAGRRPNARLQQTGLAQEALLRARSGDPVAADELMRSARASDAAAEQVYERFNAFVGAQVLLERGDFAASAAEAQRAVELDRVLDQPLEALNGRLMVVRARVAGRQRVTLQEGLALPREAQELGAVDLATTVRQWMRLDDLLHGERDTELPDEAADHPESQALHLETRALRDGRPDLLLDAAEAWAALGATVWPARALIWHSELTGVDHPEVTALLAAVGAPASLRRELAGQVR